MSLRRVAIVEDDSRLRAGTSRQLQEEGLDVQEYAEVPDLATAARHRTPDVVILDAHLRESAGRETLELAQAAFPGVTLVVWTGDHSPTLRRALLAAGCDEVVWKAHPDWPVDRFFEALRSAHARRLGWLRRAAADPLSSARLALEAARTQADRIEQALDPTTPAPTSAGGHHG